MKLTRQEQVDIPDKNQINSSPLEFTLHIDTSQDNIKSNKKKMQKKQRKKKIGNLKNKISPFYKSITINSTFE